jgi:hypothetical protein
VGRPEVPMPGSGSVHIPTTVIIENNIFYCNGVRRSSLVSGSLDGRS